MTREETLAILSILKASYPAFYKDASKQDMASVLGLWHEMFAEEAAIVVTQAVKALISTNKFPPTIADVKEKIRLITEKPSITEYEAWNIVKSAIQGAYYSGKENFEKLPQDIQAIVGSPKQLAEWGMMDESEVNTVVASNFMRSYKAKQAQNKEYMALPQSVKQYIEQNTKFNLPALPMKWGT